MILFDTTQADGIQTSLKDELSMLYRPADATAGIIDKRRLIHLFRDPNDYTGKIKVILVNISASSTNKMNHTTVNILNRSHGVVNFMASYGFEGVMDITEKDLLLQFATAILTLKTARRIVRETDTYINVTRHNDNAMLYSETHPDRSMGDVIDPINPQFYTAEQESAITGDINDIYSNRNTTIDNYVKNDYLGRNLIDDVTHIQLHHMKDYSNVHTSLFGTNASETTNYVSDEDLYYEQDTTPDPLAHVIEDTINSINNTHGLDTSVHGGLFIYDSQKGWNYDGGGVMFANNVTQEHVRKELLDYTSTLRSHFEDIEAKHGSIYLLYAPDITGDNCRIIFKDMEGDSIHGFKKIDGMEIHPEAVDVVVDTLTFEDSELSGDDGYYSIDVDSAVLFSEMYEDSNGLIHYN